MIHTIAERMVELEQVSVGSRDVDVRDAAASLFKGPAGSGRDNQKEGPSR